MREICVGFDHLLLCISKSRIAQRFSLQFDRPFNNPQGVVGSALRRKELQHVGSNQHCLLVPVGGRPTGKHRPIRGHYLSQLVERIHSQVASINRCLRTFRRQRQLDRFVEDARKVRDPCCVANALAKPHVVRGEVGSRRDRELSIHGFYFSNCARPSLALRHPARRRSHAPATQRSHRQRCEADLDRITRQRGHQTAQATGNAVG